MEKILIVGCKRAMDDVCIGCSRCIVGLNRKDGEFERYTDQDTELIGLLNCGDCPGASIVTRLARYHSNWPWRSPWPARSMPSILPTLLWGMTL